MTEFKFYDPSSSSSYDVSTSSGGGSNITVKSGPKTDWWRSAEGSTPESNVERRSGPVVYTALPRGDWQISGWIKWGEKARGRFEQTTIFVSRDGLQQGKTGGRWFKTGIEEDQGSFVGAVVTAPYSDWSISSIAASTPSVFLQVARNGADIHISYALESDPKRIVLLREIKGFARADGDGADEWVAGVMVCGPKSESTEGVVSEFRISGGAN